MHIPWAADQPSLNIRFDSRSVIMSLNVCPGTMAIPPAETAELSHWTQQTMASQIYQYMQDLMLCPSYEYALGTFHVHPGNWAPRISNGSLCFQAQRDFNSSQASSWLAQLPYETQRHEVRIFPRNEGWRMNIWRILMLDGERALVTRRDILASQYHDGGASP